MKEYFLLYLKGMAMGAADVVPGVSGGTIAFITGIYERLLGAIKSFDLQAAKLFMSFRFAEFAKHTDFKFLISILLGIATSVLSLAKLFHFLLEQYPVLTMAFFFGLILATVFVVGKEIKNWQPLSILNFVIGVSLAITVAFLSPQSENSNVFYLFLCGTIAICSMILPGVSGSFVLLIMGNYFLVIGIISGLNKQVKELDFMALYESFLVLLPFALGAIVGLLSFSRVLSWLFERYKTGTLAVLTGFILGSLSIIYPWKEAIKETRMIAGVDKTKIVNYTYYLPEIDTHFFIALGIMLLGVLVVLGIESLGNKKGLLE
jgi:putative membrane protein